MFNTLKSTALVAGMLAAAAAYTPTQSRAQGKALKDITFSLDFIVLGRHAPWYVALAKGYYKEEGLNVKIIPGKGSASVISNVESTTQ